MITHELLRITVIEAKFISYEQFMDDLQEYEISSLINMLKYADKNKWLQTRLMMYASLLPYFKKGADKDIEKFLPLPFDEDEKHLRKDITNDEIRKMNKLTHHVADILNRQKNANN